jgi:hypothetical protein
MATIHKTTLTPSKPELLAAWLPAQPWYAATGSEPRLARAGGFRLDDPAGQVGIEFVVATDMSAGQPTTYLLPMTYRGAALAGAEAFLIGTATHGVLGPRWIYDGPHDPILARQLLALIHGDAVAQAQNMSDTPDPTVTVRAIASGLRLSDGYAVASGPFGTDLRAETDAADGERGREAIVRINRVLRVDGAAGAAGEPGEPWQSCLSASWQRPDGTRVRGELAWARWA